MGVHAASFRYIPIQHSGPSNVCTNIADVIDVQKAFTQRSCMRRYIVDSDALCGVLPVSPLPLQTP